jgi:Sulfite exporter TauE/SafE
MSFSEVALFVGLGAVVGFAGGLFVIGGALIAIPLLTAGFGFTQHDSRGTAMVMALASASVTLLIYARIPGVGDRPSGLLVGGLRAVGRRARARLGCRRARAARDADGSGHEAAAAEALFRSGAIRRWVTARRRPLKTAAGRGLGSLVRTLAQ